MGWNKPRNKYNAHTAEYKGIKYHSKLEAEMAMWLDSLVKDGSIKEVQRQYKIDLSVNNVHVTTHIVDFLVTLNDGRQKFCECKGFVTDVWGIKRRLTEALYKNKIEYVTNPTLKYLLR